MSILKHLSNKKREYSPTEEFQKFCDINIGIDGFHHHLREIHTHHGGLVDFHQHLSLIYHEARLRTELTTFRLNVRAKSNLFSEKQHYQPLLKLLDNKLTAEHKYLNSIAEEKEAQVA
jgi:hypothetical protein